MAVRHEERPVRREHREHPTPIISGEFVFAAAGYGRGAALLKVTKDGAQFAVEEVYWNKAR
ncbi:hypothetical protein [Gemmata palustris]|uniref:hypothetical protein n=1 Tax=Gemmata palustris TaxID=2822762 RepID=UPI001FE8FBDE|nr:hypothetical protein [Gemmata palustris]